MLAAAAEDEEEIVIHVHVWLKEKTLGCTALTCRLRLCRENAGSSRDVGWRASEADTKHLKRFFLSPLLMCADVCVHGDDVAMKGYCVSMTGAVTVLHLTSGAPGFYLFYCSTGEKDE